MTTVSRFPRQLADLRVLTVALWETSYFFKIVADFEESENWIVPYALVYDFDCEYQNKEVSECFYA